MVFIFTALFPEAKPLIKKLGLKKRTDSARFQQFVSESLMKTDYKEKTDDILTKKSIHQKDLGEKKSQEVDSFMDDVGFQEPRTEIVLTITGVGPISAAAAVSATLTEYDIKQTDQILSFGTAAMLHKSVMREGQLSASKTDAKPNEKKADDNETFRDASSNHMDDLCQGSSLFLINKMLDQNADRTFYPDMLIRSSIPEASAVTGSTVLSDRAAAFMDMAAADYDLYDMEAAAVYQAAAFFAGPHQMSFLRVVTDGGIHDDYDIRQMSQIVTERVAQCVDEIVEYVEKLIAVSERDEQKSRIMSKSDDRLVEKVVEDGHFSKVMQDQFRQYVKYAVLSGVNWRSTVEALYRDEALPTIDKRGGKKVLDAIRSSITE